MDNSVSEKRFALLIDADNVSAKYLKPILDELSKYGAVTYKRIYGDWTLNLHAKWKDTLLKNSITPIQQFGYTQGKNATDSAMIIDAMDILYANSVEGFCIVSSDSDFTRLAMRLRESGRMVIGMGEKKTPIPFRTACDVFTTLELLLAEKNGKRRRGTDAGASAEEATVPKNQIEQAVVDIITDNQNNGKATGLGEIGSRLQKLYPDFDVRSYGTNLLSKLLHDFSSVVITKVGSNVNVELADDKVSATKAAQEEEPAEPEAHAEEAEAERSTRSRRRRRSRNRGKAVAEVDAEDIPANEAVDEAPSAEPEQAEPATEPEPAAEAPAEKPARRTRSRRGRKKAEPQTSEPAAPEEPKPDASPTPQDNSQVDAFIRKAVAEAGEEGAAVGKLGRSIRAKFRTFKLRELGFQNLRAYLATIDGITVEKQGREYFAKIKE